MGNTDEVKIETQKDSKNTPIVTSFIVFIEAGAAFISNDSIKNFVTIGAPIVTYLLAIAFNSIIHSIESKRGIIVYEDMIKDVESQIKSCTVQSRIEELEKELTKLRLDLQQAKKEAIKIVIY